MISVSPVGCKVVNLTRTTPILVSRRSILSLLLCHACHGVIGCFRLSLIEIVNQSVGRAADAASAAVQDVSVNHFRSNIFVSQEFLDRANVATVGQQVRRE